ncbi:hypothetical protein KC19_1G212600 [Ceratodon purpureus]|uniref:beta-ketoacyl-[acyl-carrier-protein] synthase I n=1 Tax=Ceratodon purpureus TaxID=3225 RepID=A0A8T0JAQ9_CERPU|nr:hypothetical protein KC19_1G212600 [Ceratodon purpureus]
MTIGAASPLCTWLFAACMSSAVSGFADDASVSSGPSGRPSGSRLRRRNASSKRLAGASWSVKTDSVQSRSFANVCMGAPCGSGISGLGSYPPFESCPEDDSIRSETGPAGDVSFFGAGLPGLKTRPVQSLRRPVRASAGKAFSVATHPVQPIKESFESKKTSTKPRRVVVTGMGVVSSLGHDADTFYANLLEGKSGVSEIENFDCKEFPTRIAGEIKSFSPDGWVAGKFAKRMDKFMLYLLTAGKKAASDAGLLTEDQMKGLDKSRCGVLIGSAMGGMQIFNDAIEALRVSYRKMNPFCVPFATTNMGSAMLAMDLGWMGPNYSISTACATSNFCILSAANHIIRGEADIMLSGGSDAAVIPIGLGGFVACRALSQRNDDPSKASRPWDKDRDGFVMGEGAGVLLLEELEHAKVETCSAIPTLYISCFDFYYLLFIS